MKATYTKALEDGRHEYGFVIRRQGKRDKLEMVGVASDYALASKAAAALSA